MSRRRWFIAVLCAMVVLAVTAGIGLSRLRATDVATGLGAGPATGTEAAAGVPVTVQAKLNEIATT